MKIAFLDFETLGNDVTTDAFAGLGELIEYANTAPDEVAKRLRGVSVVVVNKIRLNAQNLADATDLRLICLAATGYDNVDLDFCRAHGIAVCNVVGYSTQSVAQLTVTMALSLITHLPAYHEYVRSGAYTKSGVANRLIPQYHEIFGKTWGIVGYGNIGRQVACVARALGCRVLAFKRTPTDEVDCVDLERLCRESDVISIHTPLNDSTRNLIDAAHIKMMKRDAIVINVARGAVTDEAALAEAIREGRLGGLGVDVFSREPFDADHPFATLSECENVCLTPHMAWGAYETRVRLMEEMAENLRSFLRGETRNRVDLS